MTSAQNDLSPDVNAKRVLCIVSVYRPDLMQHATRAFADVGTVEVIMDRRVGERRRPERANSEESRMRDRRRRALDEQLRTRGFVLVPRSG